MREIKFRAWDNHCSMEIVFGIDEYSLYFEDVEPEDGLYGVTSTITRDTRSAWELMQYTGLKDKNGVEIYEGDICKRNDKWVAEVLWYEKEAMFDFSGWNITLDRDNLSQVEVIGNIYENPELLEST